MKNLISLVVILLANLSVFAQSPQNINYQAVVRNNTGDVIKNQNVRFRLSITEGATGITSYSETHQTTTNSLGLVNLSIGGGTVATGTFASINWTLGLKFLKVEVDVTGGSNYTLMGSQQFISVPYSLHANTAGSVNNQWQFNTNGIHYNLGKVGIGTALPKYKLTLEGDGNGIYNDGEPDNRSFLNIKNTSTSQYATANAQLFCGSTTFTKLEHVGANYFLSDFSDFGQIWSTGKGLILRASATSVSAPNTAVIKFLTGFKSDGGSFERMRIDQNGNLGVGTQSPKFKFTVEGDGSGVYNDGEPDNRTFLNLKNTSTSQYATVNAELICGSNSFTKLTQHGANYFLPDFADHAQLWTTGKGLILRASPTSPNEPNTGVIKFMTGYANVGTSNERMRITTDGNIGMGTADPKAKLHIEGNTTGNESNTYDSREYLRIQNNSNSIGSAASLSITAGPNAGSTNLWHISPTYTPRPQDQDFTILYSSGKGVSFWNSPKANNANGGYFKFQTGLKPDNTGGFDRLVINSVGNVGIGNSDPKAKLEIKDGDVYVNDPTKGIILKSPNGGCWRVTVDNTGNFVRAAITCPN